MPNSMDCFRFGKKELTDTPIFLKKNSTILAFFRIACEIFQKKKLLTYQNQST